MAQSLYAWLQSIGYTHPLHPLLTHLPLGLIVGAFLLGLTAWVLRKPAWAQSARHCIVLALIVLPATAAAGYMDWMQFYAGAFILPIQIKLGLAGVLMILLLAAAFRRPNPEGPVRVPLALYFLCLLASLGLGFFGGELVHGTRTATPEKPASVPAMGQGATLFQTNCAACHWTESTEIRVGPGLKGISKLSQLPTSKWPADDGNLRRQIRTPFAGMPPFDQLSEEEVQALITYLKTL